MRPASEVCSYLEELSCQEDSLKGYQFFFNQNQGKRIAHKMQLLELHYGEIQPEVEISIIATRKEMHDLQVF